MISISHCNWVESEQSHDDWQENSATPINDVSQDLNWDANMNALIVNMALLQVAMYETNKQHRHKPCWTQLQVTEHWIRKLMEIAEFTSLQLKTAMFFLRPLQANTSSTHRPGGVAAGG